MAGARDARSRSPRGGAVDLEEVGRLVHLREHARLNKDFAEADSLREQLAAIGVTLFDKTNTWRTSDGRGGRIPTFSELQAGAVPEAIQEPPVSALADGGGSGDDPALAQIKRLVQAREQARAAKDFEQSDNLRGQLKDLGVEVFDKEKIWRAQNGMSGCVIGYGGMQNATDMEITTLVMQREKARQGSDWATADMIRDELKQVGVDVKDKEKIWTSSDGRSGAVPSWSAMEGGDPAAARAPPPLAPAPSPYAALPSPYTMRASPYGAPTRGAPKPVVANDLQSQLVQAALQAARNPQTAARTLQLLQQAAAPPLRGGRPPPQPPPHKPPAAQSSPAAEEALGFIDSLQAEGRAPSDEDITWLVETREKLRHGKDFKSADEVRNAMKSALGVELHEKEKRWAASDGRQGSIPTWSQMALV